MFRGLFDLPALQSRSRAATDATTSDLLSVDNLDDPFRVMKADQAQQAGDSPWAPFYQALNESGNGKKVRIVGSRPSIKGLDQDHINQLAQLQGIRNQ